MNSQGPSGPLRKKWMSGSSEVRVLAGVREAGSCPALIRTPTSESQMNAARTPSYILILAEDALGLGGDAEFGWGRINKQTKNTPPQLSSSLLGLNFIICKMRCLKLEIARVPSSSASGGENSY